MLKRLFCGFGFLAIALFLGALPARAQDTQNFTITSFKADYYVSRASDNVGEMRVKEKIIAQFPDYDQNHGILRALPQSYDGHSLELKVDKVQKSDGSNWDYSTYTENDNLVLKIGDKNSYVHGQQEYDIEYTVRGVANVPTASRIFWDANGDQWQQPFGEVTARVHLPVDLAAGLQAGVQCFTGFFGSSEQSCQINISSEGDGKLVAITATRALNSGETLSFSLPFASGMFAPYKMSSGLLNYIILLVVIETIPSIIALFVVIRAWLKRGRDPKGKGVIVPQYLPPKEVGVMGSSELIKQGFAPKAISATIIDLAVRHYIKIYETGKKTFGGYKYDLELIKTPTGLRSEESAVIKMLFGDAKPGKRIALDDLSQSLYKEAQELGKVVEEQMTKDGYFTVKPGRARLPYFIVGGVIAVLGIIFPPYTLGLLPAGLICLIGGVFMAAPTVRGAELKEYLLGLRDYMKLAETDRLKVLQSPRGGLTDKIDISDKGKLVKLYERLLPYAMLFDLEKDWAKQFADLYERQPDWYSSTGTFNAIYFASAVSGLGTATVASFSPPSSSASGAGGGGGGGGGGGW